MRATCCERKGPTAYSISFLVGFIKDLVFCKFFFEMRLYEPSTEALHDAVIHACLGVEVIPQGPFQGDHMGHGRVEMPERSEKQCRTLRISAEQNTSVRISDDSLFSHSASSFCSASHEQNEGRHRRKNE